jgi:hypothetical protein
MVEGLLAANARWLLGQWPACHLSTAAATPSTTSAMEKLGPHARCRDRRLVGRLVIKAPTCIEHAEHIGPHWTPLDPIGLTGPFGETCYLGYPWISVYIHRYPKKIFFFMHKFICHHFVTNMSPLHMRSRPICHHF